MGNCQLAVDITFAPVIDTARAGMIPPISIR